MGAPNPRRGSSSPSLRIMGKEDEEEETPIRPEMAGYHPTKEQIKENDPYKEILQDWPEDRDWWFVIKNGMRADMGARWSIRKLQEQLHDDIYMCAAIFIICEAITAISCTYWRPLFWSLFWIALTVIISAIGLCANQNLHTLGLIIFLVTQVMFSAINLQHVNALRSTSIRECAMRQLDYQNCDVPSLAHCIGTNACKKSEINDTCHLYGKCCKAPGKVECDDLSTINVVFWLNFLINFLSYAEPVFYAMLLIVRQEIVRQSESPRSKGPTTKFRQMLRDLNGGKSPFKELPDSDTNEYKGKDGGGWDWRPAAVLSTSMIIMIIITIVFKTTGHG